MQSIPILAVLVCLACQTANPEGLFAYGLQKGSLNEQKMNSERKIGLKEPYLKKLEWQREVQTEEDRERLAFFQSLCERQTYQKPLGVIPKVLHIIWLGPNPFPLHALSSIRSWIVHHPDWKLKWWTDHTRVPPLNAMQVCTLESFPLEEWADIYYNAQSFEERSLILRYAILLSEGGVFIDYNTECLSSFEPLRAANDFFCGLEIPGSSTRSSCINPSCHLLASTPHHPILTSVKQWLTTNWQEYEELFPGTDFISIANRMMHRSMHALSVAIEKASGINERNDRVLPPHFFNSSERDSALYAVIGPKALLGRRIQQEESEEKVQEAFGVVRKKQRMTLMIIFVLAALNLCLGIGLFQLYRKRRNK